MHHADDVILGGGVAGLCAAKRLLELGKKPLVIEAGSYPTHKVCGEFLSPFSLTILKRWDIHPLPISHIHLETSSKQLLLLFPKLAGALSHFSLDFQLAQQIKAQGATLLTSTKVIDFSPAKQEGDLHILSLSSGEKIAAKHLFIATGRLPGYSFQHSTPRYIGIKAHFSGLTLNSTLYMFSFKGAYLGIAPIEEQKANVACLATTEAFQQFSSSHHFMQNLIFSHPALSHLLASGSNLFNAWLEAPVSEFGLRSLPHWPHTYWIGDAAGTIPPASGNGLSLAILSGYLAAEFAVKEQFLAFKQTWQKRCASQIKWGKRLHTLFLNPVWGSKGITLARTFPFIAKKIFEWTRDS